jgi:hypothetical protein
MRINLSRLHVRNVFLFGLISIVWLFVANDVYPQSNSIRLGYFQTDSQRGTGQKFFFFVDSDGENMVTYYGVSGEFIAFGTWQISGDILIFQLYTAMGGGSYSQPLYWKIFGPEALYDMKGGVRYNWIGV